MSQEHVGAFRQAAGRFASGVTVVTTKGDDGAYGVTVSSFASLSLNPLLVTVSINRHSPLLLYVREAGAFAVSVLAGHQEPVAAYFATRGRTPEPDGFSGVRSGPRETGVPVIEEALSWFDCTLDDALPGGDHEILLGRVVAAGGTSGEPLVYWAGGYRALRSDSADPTADAAAELQRAADGLAIALHLLDLGVPETVAAQLAVEPALSRLAAAGGRPAHWDRLDDLIDRATAAVDRPEEFNDLSLAVHDLIAEAAGNRALQATLLSLRRVQTRHYAERGTRATADAALLDHRGIAAALRAGDAEAAGTLMEQHLSGVRHRLGA